MLARRPGFSVLATLTLALGIAATTVVFSFAYGVLLSPLPYANAARLTLLWEYDRTARTDPGEEFGPVTTIPPADLLAWQGHARSMQQLEGLTFGFYSIRQGASPTEAIGGRVTRGFFHAIGVAPLLGRTFAPGDPDDVVVLGYNLWQTQYGGDRGIVGRHVVLGGAPYTVLGVLPPQFFFYMREFALWTPLTLRPDTRRPVMGVGLLAPGATADRAQEEFDALAGGLDNHRGVRLNSVRAQYSRFYRPTLGRLLASVGFLLLIACANVASLLLARATERQREMAIRAALGASRLQIVRQLLGESVGLALFAGAIGVLLAVILVPLARTLLPMKLPIPLPGIDAIAVSTPVLLFSSAVSMVTVLVFGLLPALRSATATLNVRDASPGVAQRRFLEGIVVAELALSVLLLASAGTAARSVFSLYHGTGFRADHLLTFRTPTTGIEPDRLVRFYDDVLERVQRLPGVRIAAAAYSHPGEGGNAGTALFVEGGTTDPKDAVHGGLNSVSAAFFAALRIPIVAGRTFSARDGRGAPEVVIVSAALARKLFPGADPIGRRVRIGGQTPDRWLTVCGIAGDVRGLLDTSPQSIVYRPFAQNPPGAIGFLVRTAGPPLELAPAVQKAVWEILPGQPITYLGTVEGDLDEQGFRQRLSAIGLGWFAGLGLVLAAVGIYGLIAYVVRQRLREFGVRVALGATAGNVAALVLRRGALLIAIGLLLGAASSLLLTTVDVQAEAAAAAVLAAIGLAACYLPARRAAAVDPMTVLRGE